MDKSKSKVKSPYSKRNVRSTSKSPSKQKAKSPAKDIDVSEKASVALEKKILDNVIESKCDGKESVHVNEEEEEEEEVDERENGEELVSVSNKEGENLGISYGLRRKRIKASKLQKRKLGDSANVAMTKNSVTKDDRMCQEVRATYELSSGSSMVLRSPRKALPYPSPKRKRLSPRKRTTNVDIVGDKHDENVVDSSLKREPGDISLDDLSSPSKSDDEATEGTESESDASHKDDFPTEGLLEELHFLNASCEQSSFSKMLASQGNKTPKKQKKSEVSGHEVSRYNSHKRKLNVKKIKNETDNTMIKKEEEVSGQLSESSVGQTQLEEEDPEDSDEGSLRIEDSDEGSLRIVAEEENPKKRKASCQGKPRRKLHPMDSGGVPQEVIELIQSGIDEVLEEKAERTQLTAIHVKNIIKNVMTDENVLAMVRNTVLGINTPAEQSTTVYEPTLTRAKTKEIIQQQAEGLGQRSIWAELSKTTTTASTSVNPETRALVATDFPEEDEDEEYIPDKDEHFHSDDESMVSTNMCSSIGSPTTPFTPTTPLSSFSPNTHASVSTPCTASDVDSPAQPVDKRLQELRPKNAQRVLDFEQPFPKEELVSQRTRSKLPLTETPLESLEMAFNPPDVTDDMYETKVLDDDWKNFLIDFVHPLESSEVVEDEEADPEYNILEDKNKEDASDLREEMRGDRAVQISKKEMNDLITELLGTLVSDEEATEPVRKHLSQHMNTTPYQRKKPPPLKNNESIKEEPTKEEVGLPPDVIWVEVLTAKFTPHQLDILRQQMTQHVQLLATTMLLSDDLSDRTVPNSALMMLEEIKTTGEISEFKNSHFHPFNLDAALSTVEKFKEKNPQKPPKANTQYLNSWSVNRELTPRVVDAILDSTAFPYPNLLPSQMFSTSMKRINKTIFVPGEDMLVTMALHDHLNPQNEPGKVVKLPASLPKILKKCLKERVLHKNANQVNDRMKNLRVRLKEHIANNNPLAIFVDSGVLKPAVATLEPLLLGTPCPVKYIPVELLPDAWQKIRKSRRQMELQQLRLNYGGLRPLRKAGTQPSAPQTSSFIPIVPNTSTLPTMSYQVPGLSVISPVTTIQALPLHCSLAEQSSLVNSVISMPQCTEQKFSEPFVLQPGMVNVQPVVSGDSTKLLSFDSAKTIAVKSEKLEIQEDAVSSNKICGDTLSLIENSNVKKSGPKTVAAKSSRGCNKGERKKKEKQNLESNAANQISENSNVSSNDLSSKVSLEKNNEFSLETPHKSPCPPLEDIPTPNLHMPSFLCTPEKSSSNPVNDKNVMPVKYSLCWEKKDKQNPNSVVESVGVACKNPENSDVKNRRENSPQKNVTNTGDAINILSEEKQSNSLQINSRQGSSLDIQGPINTPSATLVTSIYQSPIPSSGVCGTGSIQLIVNMSPQKAYSPYRKISPAKILRSPIKTSPMKKVSPILKKYRYRKKILPGNKKLSPILPKLTPQKPQQIRPAAQRRLTPKAPKENLPRDEPQNYTTNKSSSINQLSQVGNELPSVDDAASDSRHIRSTVPQLEEEFEEDDLEEEEEEEEEEDSEAAQQREEHLAALLKASSTIVGKKGDKMGGGDIGPAERRLNKQQKRLQARITALSIVHDSLSKDITMAQSYLTRVREALIGKDPALYKKFLCILNEFTENCKDSPVELYRHLCKVLKDFPQLKEEFVSFLLPQQAMAIGKYAQYCAIHRMKDFLDKLKLQFRKQPQHIQKIVRALQALQNVAEVDNERIKASICPLLRYPHLVESFMQCFPSQPPPPSLSSDFEDISLEKSPTPDCVESVKLPDDDTVTSPDQCGCPCHVPTVPPSSGSSSSTVRSDHCQSCAIRFSEGRVYLQYGKTLRPAKVTYHPIDGDKKDSSSGSDGHDASAKYKGPNSRKTLHTKDSSESGLTRNKENLNTMNMENSTSNCIDHKGSLSVGEKGAKDELQNVYSKQKESSSGRGSQSKKSLSSKFEEKGGVVEDDGNGESQQTPSVSGIVMGYSTKTKSSGNMDIDINMRTRRKSVANFDSLQENSVLSKKCKEFGTHSGHKKDVPNVTTKMKKINNESVGKCTSNSLCEKSDIVSALPVSEISAWTIDEDRIMLTFFQRKGSTESAAQEILRFLPHRSYDEVYERLNILVKQMMEESEMEEIMLSSEDDSTKD